MAQPDSSYKLYNKTRNRQIKMTDQAKIAGAALVVALLKGGHIIMQYKMRG